MNRMSAQTQLILIIGLLVLFAAVVVLAGIIPTFGESSRLDDSIAQANMDLQSARTLLTRRQAAKAEAAANQVELLTIANRIPDSPQLPTVIIQLQDTANAAGLDFVEISPQDVQAPVDPAAPNAPAAQQSAYLRVPINVVLHGDWADIIEFTRKLNQMDRAIRITGSNFTNVEETEDEERYVEANITLEVYVMDAAQTNGSVSASPGASSEATTTSE